MQQARRSESATARGDGGRARIAWRRRRYATCIAAACSLVASLAASAGDSPRFFALLANGERVAGSNWTHWEESPAEMRLDDRPLWIDGRGPRWFGRVPTQSGADTGFRPARVIELRGGDVVPGEVLSYVPARVGVEPADSHPAHLVVRCDAQASWPTVLKRDPTKLIDPPRTLRIVATAVERIGRDATSGRRAAPGTARLRDGRTLSVRSVRWFERGVELLATEGVVRVEFGELLELSLPPRDPWRSWFEQRAALTFDGAQRLACYRTIDGLRITTAADWFQMPLRFVPSQRVPEGTSPLPDRFFQLVRPAWSQDALWLDFERIADRIEFGPDEVPLSCLVPDRIDRAPGLVVGERFERDRSAGNSPLRSGERLFGWGLGVHGGTRVEYELSPAVRSFRTHVGLDALAGAGGCAGATVAVVETSASSDETARTLFASPTLIGTGRDFDSDRLTIATTDASPATQRRLVLTTNAEPLDVPAGADPLDVRDFVNWLEPTLTLDPQAIPPVDPQAPGSAEFAAGEGDAPVWPLVLLKTEPRYPFMRAAFSEVVRGFRTDVPFDRADPEAHHQWYYIRAHGGRGVPPSIELPACENGVPVLLRKRVDVPRDGTTRLELTVTHNRKKDWRLVVTASGKRIHDETIGPPRSPDEWSPVAVDLTPFAGRRITLEAGNFGDNRYYSHAYVGRIDVVTQRPDGASPPAKNK